MRKQVQISATERE